MMSWAIDNDTHHGSQGNDFLDGGEARDEIYGRSGDDTLIGGQGFNKLWGGAGKDTFILNHGYGHDIIKDFTNGDDRIQMQPGWSLKSHDGHAEIYAGDDLLAIVERTSNDELTFLYGGKDNNQYTGSWRKLQDQYKTINRSGGYGNDRLAGRWGNDYLWGGGYGDDSFDGGWGDDTLIGGFGNDTLKGGWGNDYLSGKRLNDTLEGGWGDDTLTGGYGVDIVKGGVGKDTFILSYVVGHDIIKDFTIGDDRIVYDTGSKDPTVIPLRIGKSG